MNQSDCPLLVGPICIIDATELDDGIVDLDSTRACFRFIRSTHSGRRRVRKSSSKLSIKFAIFESIHPNMIPILSRFIFLLASLVRHFHITAECIRQLHLPRSRPTSAARTAVEDRSHALTRTESVIGKGKSRNRDRIAHSASSLVEQPLAQHPVIQIDKGIAPGRVRRNL